MERREFLKLTLGLTAAAGAIAATAVSAQAAPMLPQAGDAPPADKPHETAAQPEAKDKSDGDRTSVASSDTDMSSQYWRRRRRRYWRRARRRYWRRRRWWRGRWIYY